MMMIDEKFSLGQIVYLKVDPEQRPNIVVSISIRPGHLVYMLSNGVDNMIAYDIELSDKKDVSAFVL